MTAPTPRQVEVLRAYVATGSYGAAADSLGIAKATVRNHLHDLRLRLGVGTTAQAVFLLHDDLVHTDILHSVQVCTHH